MGRTASGAAPAEPETPRAAAQGLEDRPNILVIVTDDQRARTLSTMPVVRRVFRRGGTEFTPGFATTPLCCPSRASIYSGRFMHNHGVIHNGRSEMFDEDLTVQRYLHDSGYRTGLFGKFLNGWPTNRNPDHFDVWTVSKGFPYYGGVWNVQGETQWLAAYSTTVVRRHALRFLEDAEAHDSRPWFMYVSPIAPHGPSIPEQKHEHAAVRRWPGNPAVFERNLNDKPAFVRDSHVSCARVNAKRRDQLRTLISIDRLVRRLYSTLNNLDEKRDTLAFYVSDNGLLWGEHNFRGKTVPYLQSIEIPFFMKWPGRSPAGTRDDRIAATIDIAPTIMEAAGIQAEPGVPMDGRSLLDDWRRQRLLIEYRHYEPFPTPSWASLVTRRWQYSEYYGYYGDDPAITLREYYRLGPDPWQLRNLLGDSRTSNDPDVSRLRAMLRRDSTCVGPTCP